MTPKSKWSIAMSLILVAATGLAGCAAPEEGTEPDDGLGDDGLGDDNVTPGDGDDNATDGGANGTANVASVTVSTAPETASVGDAVEICWDVDGTGNIPHTAIHWDTESHEGDDATFADYAGGAIYPDDTAAEAPEGYELPGTFCANLDVQEAGTIYYRAHAMIEPPGIVSEELSFTVE